MPRKRRKPKLDLKPILVQPPSFEIAECEFSYNSKMMRKVSIGSDGIHSPEKKKSIIKHVNELSLGRLLGEGAESKVFLAEHSKTNLNIAVKVVEILDRCKRKQFRRDLVVLQNIESKYLTKCYDVFFKPRAKEMWICLEFMDCGSLARILETAGPIPESALKTIAFFILKGLQKLHKSKVYHRDIKPANVLINSNGVAKLADFGISKSESESVSRSRGFAIGTTRYISPERVQGQSYDFNSDIWALGIMLYECATGSHPFIPSNQTEEDSNLHLLSSIMMDDIPPLPKHFSNEFNDFISSCLIRDPEMRPTEDDLLAFGWLQDADQTDLRQHAKAWLLPEGMSRQRSNCI